MTHPIILTKREYATHKGWSPSYLTQLRKEGRLVLTEDGRVDVAATEAQLKATRDPGKDHVASRHAAKRAEPPENDSEPIDRSASPDADEARIKVKKLRELVATEMDRIDLGLITGELVERRAVDPLWAGLGVSIRARLDALVERLTPRLSACAGSAERAALIRAALREERHSVKKMLISALKQIRPKTVTRKPTP